MVESLAYREILGLSIEHKEGLECQRRKCQMIHNVLREAKDTAGRIRVLFASQPRMEQLGGRYFETMCRPISCVENRYTAPQIAELIGLGISPHAYLEVVMSSTQKESKPRLHIQCRIRPHKFMYNFFTSPISPQFMLCLYFISGCNVICT